MKVCIKCKEEREDEFFGSQCWCKPCVNLYSKKRGKTKEGKLKTIYNDQVNKSKKETINHQPTQRKSL